MNRVRASIRTHIGHVRNRNQDTIGLSRLMTVGSPQALSVTVDLDEPFVVAVADGMGGHLGGEMASRLAIQELLEGQDDIAGMSEIRDRILSINRSVFEESLLSSARSAMGSTLAGMWISSTSMCIFNVGDSPVYEVVDGYLMKRSVDDVRRTASGGTGGLTQSLGGTHTAVTLDPHTYSTPTVPGRWLVCSDGLSGEVSLGDMQSIISDRSTDVSAAAEDLLGAALAAGAPDNVSIAVVDVVGV